MSKKILPPIVRKGAESKLPPPKRGGEITPVAPVELPYDPEAYFQAVGWLKGVIFKDPNEQHRFTIRLVCNGQVKEFPLATRMKDRKVRSATYLQLKHHPNEELWVCCYPQYDIPTKQVYFCLIGYEKEKPAWAENSVFDLRGIWQRIPVQKEPVFTIYRNQVDLEKEPRFRNQHLPVVWRQRYFVFNPKAATPTKPIFYQIKARFDPLDKQFHWLETIADPLAPPKRIKKLTAVKRPSSKATGTTSPKPTTLKPLPKKKYG